MKLLKKIPKTFISFLLVSILIWLFITFSKEYTTIITIPVSYSKLPKNKLLQEEPSKTLEFLVKGSGFKIISSKLTQRNITLNTNNLIKQEQKKHYFLIKKELINIQKQLPSGLQIETILQDTVYLNIDILSSKKVPVKANLNISYQVGSAVSDSLKITPDSVFIYGPKTQVNTIEFIETSTISLENVNSNFEETVEVIKPSKTPKITFSTKKIQLSGKVKKITEGSFQVPFTVMNLPQNTTLTTLTKTVKVTFIVGLADFNKINKNSFKIVCDFEVSKTNNLSYLIPKVIAKSELINSVKITPTKIDFLIQK